MVDQPAPMDKRRKRLVARLAADRRHFKRISLPLNGRYMAQDGGEYPCRVHDISPGGLSVRSDYSPGDSKHVVLMIDALGRLEGDIVRVVAGGFAVSLHSSARKRDKLGDALTWQLNKDRLGLHDERAAKRSKHKNRVYVQTADGLKFLAQSIDMSPTGMAIETTEALKIDERVRVGSLKGVVVRHLANGFALRFDPPSISQKAGLQEEAGKEKVSGAPPAAIADDEPQKPDTLSEPEAKTQ